MTAERASASRSRVRVRYAETDQMGVAYHANFLVWFEVGRTDWLRATGCTYRTMEEEGVSLPVIEAHCRYRAPARYDEELDIVTWARLLTPARVAFDYEVVRGESAEVVATGHTIHAAVDRTGRPIRLPNRIKELLA